MNNFKVYWTRYDEKFNILVGNLLYNETEKLWHFNYDKEGASVASILGFVGFPEFEDYDKVYVSKNLFDTFAHRINVESNTSELEKANYLKETKGFLVTDNILILDQETHSKGRKHGKKGH